METSRYTYQKKTVPQWLAEVDYSDDTTYVPSSFAVEMVNFIKLCNDGRGEENETPVTHYKILDQIYENNGDIATLAHRGIAKSSLLAEYLFLYIAVYGGLLLEGKHKKPFRQNVSYALYISDSIENGVKKMRRRIERRVQNSQFLKKYIPEVKFTDIRWYFCNADGHEFVVTAHGARTGVRGTTELNTRPGLAILDDLISDDDARSSTVISAVKDIVYSAIDEALHPKWNLVVWSGTPFNARDPLYSAIESGAFRVNVFPVCEKFPCEEKDFRSSWPERFTYQVVLKKYTKKKLTGKIDSFNQELMLRIMSDDDKIILPTDINYYEYKLLTQNRDMFNFYITTDFAVSDEESSDFSVINVWGLNSNRDWYWADGMCKKCLMDETIRTLFQLAQKWRPQSVAIETSATQKGFLAWIKNEMLAKNIYFALAKQTGTNTEGIRPVKDKLSRFQLNAVPLFKAGKIFLPEGMEEDPRIMEMLDELDHVTPKGIKSLHDDCIDTVTQLGEVETWAPSESMPDEAEDDDNPKNGRFLWDDHIKDTADASSYFV